MRERPGLESGSILDTGHVVSRHAGWIVNQTDPMLATLEPCPVIIINVKKNIFTGCSLTKARTCLTFVTVLDAYLKF